MRSSDDKAPEIESHYVDVGLIRTHYLRAGDGPPVVLLHSGEFGASAELTWEHNIGELARDFSVYAPDWLGFGRTDKVRDFVSGSEKMLQHMTAYVERMGLESAHFVGCSMGGSFLVREAASGHCRFPIDRMVLCSAGGFVPDNEHRRSMLNYRGTKDGMRKILQATFNDCRWWQDEAYIERRVTASLEPGAWEAIASARFKAPNIPERAEFGRPDTTPYEKVNAPTLITVGEEDKLRLPNYHAEMEARIPDVQVVVFEGAGHLLNIERATEFNRVARAFLTDEEINQRTIPALSTEVRP